MIMTDTRKRIRIDPGVPQWNRNENQSRSFLVVSVQSQNDVKYTSNGSYKTEALNTIIITILQTQEKIDIESFPKAEVFSKLLHYRSHFFYE